MLWISPPVSQVDCSCKWGSIDNLPAASFRSPAISLGVIRTSNAAEAQGGTFSLHSPKHELRFTTRRHGLKLQRAQGWRMQGLEDPRGCRCMDRAAPGPVYSSQPLPRGSAVLQRSHFRCRKPGPNVLGTAQRLCLFCLPCLFNWMEGEKNANFAKFAIKYLIWS